MNIILYNILQIDVWLIYFCIIKVNCIDSKIDFICIIFKQKNSEKYNYWFFKYFIKLNYDNIQFLITKIIFKKAMQN